MVMRPMYWNNGNFSGCYRLYLLLRLWFCLQLHSMISLYREGEQLPLKGDEPTRKTSDNTVILNFVPESEVNHSEYSNRLLIDTGYELDQDVFKGT